MFLSPYKYYTNCVSSYDLIYKNNFLSFFQIPQIKLVYLSFNLNFLNLKYILYSLLFLNILTLQKPYLNIGKKLKLNITIKRNLFIGCKVVLRKHNMYSFLNFLIITLFPKLKMFRLTKKSLIFDGSEKLVDCFTFNLTSLSVLFNELEYFYNYFQYLNNLSITVQVSQKMSKRQFLSLLYIPLKK